MNRQALITGGTKGIGLAVAEKLLQNGFDVILTYAADTQNADKVQAELSQKYTAKISILRADCSDLDSIDLINSFLSTHNITLDSLILNAGMTDRSNFQNMEITTWMKVFNANVHFPVFLIQKIVGRFSVDASVVFTGSAMGIHPHSVSLAYGVTKATIHALVKNLVKFLSPYNIRINAVAPGFVDTEWQKTKPIEVKNSINSKIALGRFCNPAELAEVYFLLIDNHYLNGEIVVVDGGYSYK